MVLTRWLHPVPQLGEPRVSYGFRAVPAVPPDVKPEFDFSAFDRIRVLSSARRVFPMGFRPQKSSKFRVPLPPRRPRPPGPNGSAGLWGALEAP